jgi:hypothetical protein
MTVASSRAQRMSGQSRPARSFPLDPAPIWVPGEVLDDLRRRLAFHPVGDPGEWVGDLRRTFRGRR